MRVSIVDSGYVGTTIVAFFSNLGHQLSIIDINQSVVDANNDAEVPIYEDGLLELPDNHGGNDRTNRLRTTTE